ARRGSPGASVIHRRARGSAAARPGRRDRDEQPRGAHRALPQPDGRTTVSSTLQRLHEDERGQALVLVAIFLLGLIAVAGLVADGGLVLAQRRDLQNAADAAAAAGAMQLDEDHYRSTAGAEVALDED